ncbi:MAG TPA: MlaD family protein [Solirubrobacteraceae bacterium]|nr:MlaD family protein [Solirubrobacteraceae bacterium]
MSRRRTSLAANPILIGAATILVAMVAVFLAYNANNGLPFVPLYTLKAQVPNAAALVRGNEVRIAGARVGTITTITPHQDARTGRVNAVLTLKLEKRIEPLPADSTVIVRARSALGLKYLQITEGTSRRGLPDGATMPLSAARPEPVELDQVLGTFDAPTRHAAAQNLDAFGTALAGRGQDLNQAIANLRPLLGDLTPAFANLASPQTDLEGLFSSLERAASAVAPVAAQEAGWFKAIDGTFRALSTTARPFLQDAISEGPASLQTATASFEVQRPFLAKVTALAGELAPFSAELRQASAPLGRAFSTGAPILRRALPFNRRLGDVFSAFGGFGTDPLALGGLSDLTELSRVLLPVAAPLNGMQSTCNSITLMFRNLASTLSDGDIVGRWLRFMIVLPPDGPNNEGAPAAAPADGPDAHNHLHANPYPNEAAPGQPRECEAGNEPYAVGRTMIGNVAGNQGTKVDRTSAGVTR